MEVRFSFKLDRESTIALAKAFAATATTLVVWHYAPGAAHLVTQLLQILFG